VHIPDPLLLLDACFPVRVIDLDAGVDALARHGVGGAIVVPLTLDEAPSLLGAVRSEDRLELRFGARIGPPWDAALRLVRREAADIAAVSIDAGAPDAVLDATLCWAAEHEAPAYLACECVAHVTRAEEALARRPGLKLCVWLRDASTVRAGGPARVIAASLGPDLMQAVGSERLLFASGGLAGLGPARAAFDAAFGATAPEVRAAVAHGNVQSTLAPWARFELPQSGQSPSTAE